MKCKICSSKMLKKTMLWCGDVETRYKCTKQGCGLVA